MARLSEAFWVIQLGKLRTLGAFSSLAELTSLAAKRKGRLYEPVRLYLEDQFEFSGNLRKCGYGQDIVGEIQRGRRRIIKERHRAEVIVQPVSNIERGSRTSYI